MGPTAGGITPAVSVKKYIPVTGCIFPGQGVVGEVTFYSLRSYTSPMSQNPSLTKDLLMCVLRYTLVNNFRNFFMKK